MATYSGVDQTAQLFVWLRLHGANPDEIPLNEDMTITTDDNGVQWLHWTQFALVNGGRYMNPWGTAAAVEKHTTRLVSPPPHWWEPVVHPTREQLRDAVEAVGKLHVRNANSGTCEHCSERDYPDYEVPWPCPTMQALGEVQPPAPCALVVDSVGATPLGPCVVTGLHDVHQDANGAKWRPNPSGIITLPEPLTAKQAEAVRAEWERLHARGRGPIEIAPDVVIQNYRTDRGTWAWVVRCWGHGDCDGALHLDLSDRNYAERKAKQHIAEHHDAVGQPS